MMKKMLKMLAVLGMSAAMALTFAACGQEDAAVSAKPESIYDIVPGLKDAKDFELGIGSREIMNYTCYIKLADGDGSKALALLEQYDFTGFEKTDDPGWVDKAGNFSNGDDLYFRQGDAGLRVTLYSHAADPLTQTLWLQKDNGEKTVYMRTVEEPPFKSFSNLPGMEDIVGECLNKTAASAFHPVDSEKGKEISRAALLRTLNKLNGAVAAGAYTGDESAEYDIRLEIEDTGFIMGFFGPGDNKPAGYTEGASRYLIDSASGLVEMTAGDKTEVYSLGGELFKGTYIELTGEQK